MRVSEKMKFHISNEEKDAFRNSSPKELKRNLLIATQLCTEMPEYFSSDEANKLKKDLDIYNKELQETKSSL